MNVKLTKGIKNIYQVVMVRHGESLWNLENRFTGCQNVNLSDKGIKESIDAGKRLKEQNFKFDLCFTSVLKRAINCFNYLAEEMDIHHIPVYKSYRLNERQYGALEGLNKSETAAKHGEQQVQIWRRSYDIPPPKLDPADSRAPHNQRMYDHLPRNALPLSESLKDTVARVIPFWLDQICPAVLEGKRVIITAHGNSIRAVMKYLDNISEKDIVSVNIPTGIPLVYEFDELLNPQRHYYLASEEEIKKRVQAVADQGKAKKK